jgi:hypothetical protein
LFFLEDFLEAFLEAFGSGCVSQSSVSQGSSSQTSSSITGSATGSATGCGAETWAGAAGATLAAFLNLLTRGLAICNILLEMNFAGKRQKTSYYK